MLGLCQYRGLEAKLNGRWCIHSCCGAVESRNAVAVGELNPSLQEKETIGNLMVVCVTRGKYGD